MEEEGPADLHTAVRPRGVWGWKLRTGIKQRTPSSNNRRKMMREKRRNSFITLQRRVAMFGGERDGERGEIEAAVLQMRLVVNTSDAHLSICYE